MGVIVMATWVLVLTAVVVVVFLSAGVWVWRHSPPGSPEEDDFRPSGRHNELSDYIW